MTSGAQVISRDELVKLCALDTDIFGKHFFPKAMRDTSPEFDPAVWAALENPTKRLVNLEIFRGGAKTTKLRIFTAKRIAYSVSRTILYVGASESHATRSVQWLRGQIEPRLGADGQRRPTEFARTFGLRPGKKWQEHEIEIFHEVDDRPIWVLGVGITGTIRGINFDDYRPDLIILDDVITDENAATRDQCEKIADLVMGAVVNSLAPSSEEPNAKIAMLQTPLSPNDASARASASSEWHTEVHGCWTKETELLSVEEQESVWPDRYPSQVLRDQKLAALAENRYSIFAREMECKLVAAESNSFRPNWLRKSEELPTVRRTVLAIDPVPPPSERELETGLKKKDFEAIGVLGVNKDGFHLLDYAVSRGHNPDWTIAKAFEFHARFRPLVWVVETVAYQRVLKWLLEKEMQRRGQWVSIKDTRGDKRKKFERILSTLHGPASAGRLWCNPLHSEFILQFESYGIGYKGNDDLLDMVSLGISELTQPYLELSYEEYEDLTDDIPEFSANRWCP